MYPIFSSKNYSPVLWQNNFLNDEDISNIFNYLNKQKYMQGIIYGNNNQSQYDKSIRSSHLKWISLNESTNWLYKKILNKIHEVNLENYNFILTNIQKLQFSQYDGKNFSFYNKHIDCGPKMSIENTLSIRKLSFSIQLNEMHEYEGGELIIYNNGNSFISPKNKGTIIFFESDMLHEVTPVTKGLRYSLVGWVCGPNLR